MKKILLGASLLVWASSAAVAADYVVPAGDGFRDDELRWDSIGKAYEFRWAVTVIDSQIAVCGVGRFLSPVTFVQTRGVLRKAAVMFEGRSILSDLSFFNTVDANVPLEGASATCRSTGQKAPKGEFGVELAISGSARF